METKTAIGCVVFIILLIPSLVMFGVSWDTVHPTQVALIFDGNVQHVEFDSVKGNGRVMVGLGRSYIKFPITEQTIKFGSTLANANGGDIYCRSRDGLQITLELQLQYVLSTDVNDLARIYTTFGLDWESTYSRMVLSVVRDVCSKYFAYDFFNSRETINDGMLAATNSAFKEVYASVTSFQWLHMDVDSSFADTITDTEIAFQDIQQAIFEQNVAMVRADSTVQVANQVSQVSLASATQTATAYITNAQTQANVFRNKIEKQGIAYKLLVQNLNFTSTESLLSYIYINSLASASSKSYVLGLSLPAAFRPPATTNTTA